MYQISLRADVKIGATLQSVWAVPTATPGVAHPLVCLGTIQVRIKCFRGWIQSTRHRLGPDLGMERAGTNPSRVLALLLGWYLLLEIALPLTLRAEFIIEDKLRTQMRKNREADPVIKPQRENTFKGKSSHAADPAIAEILIHCSREGGLFHNYQSPDWAISPALRQGGCKK